LSRSNPYSFRRGFDIGYLRGGTSFSSARIGHRGEVL
jgi:hypothetical protein